MGGELALDCISTSEARETFCTVQQQHACTFTCFSIDAKMGQEIKLTLSDSVSCPDRGSAAKVSPPRVESLLARRLPGYL